MSDNKLLLEGDDDKHLVIGLLRSHMGKSVFDFHFPKSEEPIKVKGSVSKVISDLEQEILVLLLIQIKILCLHGEKLSVY